MVGGEGGDGKCVLTHSGLTMIVASWNRVIVPPQSSVRDIGLEDLYREGLVTLEEWVRR